MARRKCRKKMSSFRIKSRRKKPSALKNKGIIAHDGNILKINFIMLLAATSLVQNFWLLIFIITPCGPGEKYFITKLLSDFMAIFPFIFLKHSLS